MHTNIHYQSGAAEDRRAVLDLVHWLGFRRSMLILRWFRSQRQTIFWTTPESARFTLSMAGVEGKPVTCAWRRWALGLK